MLVDYEVANRGVVKVSRVYSVGKSPIFKHTQLSLIHTRTYSLSLSLLGAGEGVYIHFCHSYQESRHPDPEA